MPTSVISDAMDQLDIPSGVIVGCIKILDIRMERMAGYACTVQQMPKRQVSPGKTRQLEVYDYIAQPNDVVLIDAGGSLNSATTGALQALRASVRGLSGIVLNGCCRDTDEIVEIGLPFFCLGSVPRKSVPLETVG